MKAAVFHAVHQPMTIEDVQLDKPGPNEVIVKTMASGVCHSDLHVVEGTLPWNAPSVLGHEAAGIIEEVGPNVSYVQPGDHVIVCTSVFCGQCEYCLRGRPNLCLRTGVDRTESDPPRLSWQGSPIDQFAGLATYAEKMLLHENAVVKIPDNVPFEVAALIGCGVTTGVGAALNTAKVRPGSSVAVFGAGGVGISVIQGAYLAGARQIIAVDTVETKLATARQFGATHVVDASSGDPVEKIRGLTDGEGVDYSFEAIGLKSTAEASFNALKRGGVATIIGIMPAGETIDIHGLDMLSEKTLQGSLMGSNRFRVDMPKYVDFYMQGRLKIEEMVTRKRRLEDLNDAFRAMKDGEVTRTVLMFD
jgi:S-(hydroxymethyl)glutathione dehydrogenase/alcohol dehydrogenase